MERVIDKEREWWLEEEDMARRVTLKRDTRGGLKRKDNGKEGRRSRNGRAVVEAR